MARSVAILLSTFNGARFLPHQLKSYVNQTHKNWYLIASDDGSTDETQAIMRRFERELGPGRASFRAGPAQGFVSNFLTLACEPDTKADFYAFSDQDDIWEPDKLSRALDWLVTIPDGTPAVYGSRTHLIDPDGKTIGLSPLFRKPPTFANALVQNIAGGNTMVFNEAARQLLIAAGREVDVPSHDWWLYLLTTAHGGAFFYDPHPSVRYRRHEKNLVGLNIGMIARLRRIKMLIEGRFKRWTDLNLAALAGSRAHMTAQNRALFDEFSEARRMPLPKRLLAVHRTGIYRQTVLGSIGLFVAVCLNKI